MLTYGVPKEPVLAIILIGVAVVLVVFLALVATRPSAYHVERKLEVAAPTDIVFGVLNDLRQFAGVLVLFGTPWEKLDPNMKRTLSGSPSGTGSIYEWDGNSKAGKGRMEITDAPAPSKVTIKLDFFKPFESHNTAEFKLEPRGDTTELTWAMYGPNLFIGRVMSIFFDMDKMIGKDFETGLANLKTLAEQKPADATTSRR